MQSRPINRGFRAALAGVGVTLCISVATLLLAQSQVAAPEARTPPQGATKIEHALLQLIASAEQSLSAAKETARRYHFAMAEDRIKVAIHLQATATIDESLLRSLAFYGAQAVHWSQHLGVVWAKVPILRLRAMAEEVPEIEFIRLPARPVALAARG
jgi:sugar diacid utilization regulator